MAVTDALKYIAEDPALVPFAQRIVVLHKLEESEATSSGKPASSAKGIGLSKLLGPIDAYIWVRKNPWVIPAIGIVGFLVVRKLKKK